MLQKVLWRFQTTLSTDKKTKQGKKIRHFLSCFVSEASESFTSYIYFMVLSKVCSIKNQQLLSNHLEVPLPFGTVLNIFNTRWRHYHNTFRSCSHFSNSYAIFFSFCVTSWTYYPGFYVLLFFNSFLRAQNIFGFVTPVHILNEVVQLISIDESLVV